MRPLWTTWESIVNSLVLSGAVIIVLSGARESCYQARTLPEIGFPSKRCARRNGSNKKFLTKSSRGRASCTVHALRMGTP